jgi:hypothetical protein
MKSQTHFPDYQAQDPHRVIRAARSGDATDRCRGFTVAEGYFGGMALFVNLPVRENVSSCLACSQQIILTFLSQRSLAR